MVCTLYHWAISIRIKKLIKQATNKSNEIECNLAIFCEAYEDSSKAITQVNLNSTVHNVISFVKNLLKNYA